MKNLIAVLLMLLFAPVKSYALPISLSTGETAIINFDLTTATPAPPYDSLSTSVFLSDFESVDSANFKIFAELDGLGTNLVDVTLDGPFAGVTGGPLSSDFRDGIFSWVITSVSGSFVIDDAFAYGNVGGVPTGLVGPAGVPEPTTLALMGIGLAGIGFARRKTANETRTPVGTRRCAR